MKVEYKVREVKRYIITRFESEENENGTGNGSSSVRGEFDNFDMAYNVAYALANLEHEQLGYPLGDERIMYPESKPVN